MMEAIWLSNGIFYDDVLMLALDNVYTNMSLSIIDTMTRHP